MLSFQHEQSPPPSPRPLLFFPVTQVSKSLKEKFSVLSENKVVSNTRLPSKSMSRLTKTFVEQNSVEDPMSTLWVSQGCLFLETHSSLALVWSHGMNAHLQNTSLSLVPIERNPSHKLQDCFMV